MIQSLEEKYGDHDRREVKSLITVLGLKYSRVSSHTSFIAVDNVVTGEPRIVVREHLRNQVPLDYRGYKQGLFHKQPRAANEKSKVAHFTGDN